MRREPIRASIHRRHQLRRSAGCCRRPLASQHGGARTCLGCQRPGESARLGARCRGAWLGNAADPRLSCVEGTRRGRSCPSLGRGISRLPLRGNGLQKTAHSHCRRTAACSRRCAIPRDRRIISGRGMTQRIGGGAIPLPEGRAEASAPNQMDSLPGRGPSSGDRGPSRHRVADAPSAAILSTMRPEHSRLAGSCVGPSSGACIAAQEASQPNE